MIECLRDEQGRITAVCEWLLFDEKGGLSDTGSIVYVCELEINEEHRNKDLVKRFISLIHDKCPWTERVFFYREYKYPGRRVRIYPVSRIVKRGV